MLRTCLFVLAASSLAAHTAAAGSRCDSYRSEADRTECVRTEALNEAAKEPNSWRLIQPDTPAVPAETVTRTTTTYETATGKQVRTTEERSTAVPAQPVAPR